MPITRRSNTAGSNFAFRYFAVPVWIYYVELLSQAGNLDPLQGFIALSHNQDLVQAVTQGEHVKIATGATDGEQPIIARVNMPFPKGIHVWGWLDPDNAGDGLIIKIHYERLRYLKNKGFL